jgi:hypothetical protein
LCSNTDCFFHTTRIGQSQFLTNPVPAKPLSFHLTLDDRTYDDDLDTLSRLPPYSGGHNRNGSGGGLEDSDARLMEMLAAQAAHKEIDTLGVDEDDIAVDEKLSDEEKRTMLQRSLNMAASNGDVERVRKLVQGKANAFVDVNMADEEGTPPLIYASCFVSDLRSQVLLFCVECCRAARGSKLPATKKRLSLIV